MRVFYDVDTQNDFMNKNGALYVPDAETIKPNLQLLTEYAKDKKIPILGSVDVHYGAEQIKDREGELARWGGPFPDHCMQGTYGQKKIDVTSHIGFSARDAMTDRAFYAPHYSKREITEKLVNTLVGLARGKVEQCRFIPKTPVFIEKQHYDVFTNPITEKLLAQAGVKEAVVYGVATDYCVKAAVLGMQQRGIQTYVVEDAIKGVFPETTKTALEEMLAAGAKLVTTKDVLEGRLA